jgi:hypothetical protein
LFDIICTGGGAGPIKYLYNFNMFLNIVELLLENPINITIPALLIKNKLNEVTEYFKNNQNEMRIRTIKYIATDRENVYKFTSRTYKRISQSRYYEDFVPTNNNANPPSDSESESESDSESSSDELDPEWRVDNNGASHHSSFRADNDELDPEWRVDDAPNDNNELDPEWKADDVPNDDPDDIYDDRFYSYTQAEINRDMNRFSFNKKIKFAPFPECEIMDKKTFNSYQLRIENIKRLIDLKI